MENEKTDICPDCGHSLKNNSHGPDQNDYYYDSNDDRIKYVGSCTYCNVCFPRENKK
ncbi:MAG: hypothetical protein WC554_13205 [Clostridia bacterium]